MDLFDRFNRFASQFGELIADDIRAHVELGAALLERGDYDAAIHELEAALARRRDHARALYLLGLSYMRRGAAGDRALAQGALVQAISAREGFAEAHVALGQLLLREGDLEGAAESLRVALPLIGEPSLRAEVEGSLGAVYLKMDRLDRAVRELRKAVAQSPDNAEAQGLLGQALLRSAQKKGEPEGGPTFEAARLCLQRAARAEQPSAGVLKVLGELLLAAGQIADSEKALLRALEIAPNDAGTLLSLGALRLHQGDVAAAHEQALRAAAQRPESMADVHLLLARCHARSGSPDQALAAYDLALGALPAPSASAESDGKRTAILGEALHLALKQRLLGKAARLGMARGLRETADGLAAQSLLPDLPLPEAMALQQRALATEDTVEVRLAGAAIERRRGNAAAAAASLRRAAALAPGDPRPREELGELYRKEREGLPRETYGLLSAAQRHLLHTPELASLLPEASLLLAALDRPLLLTVMGEFNSGKSTFVNALLGEEVAPMGITPTTATINILKYGRERGGRVVYRDDTSRDVSWAEVPALLKAVDESEARRIRFVEVLYPLETLQRVNVVDTPGLNSIEPEHEATAREFISQADAVVWLFTIDQAGKATEREALGTIRADGKQILGVLNKIDRLGPAAEVAVSAILEHLHDQAAGLGDLLELVVPFSGRDALLGRKRNDEDLIARSNLPALMEALEQRFFARSQMIKQAAARGRLHALLLRARALAEGLIPAARKEESQQALRLCQADALIFARDFVPAERRRLIADADEVHKLAARETLDFVRPRGWPFGENRAAPADRDFLLGLLDEKLLGMVAASRGRAVEALGEKDEGLLRLLDEQVFGRYRAFARGYLRGGKVDDFFVRVLPKLELTEAAIGRALERDAPTSIDILEAELLTPLRAFLDLRFRALQGSRQKQLDDEDLLRFDLEERVLYPIEALLAALGGVDPGTARAEGL